MLENTLTLEVTTTAGLQFDWLVFNQISSKSVVNFKIAKLPNPNDWNWRPDIQHRLFKDRYRTTHQIILLERLFRRQGFLQFCDRGGAARGQQFLIVDDAG